MTAQKIEKLSTYIYMYIHAMRYYVVLEETRWF